MATQGMATDVVYYPALEDSDARNSIKIPAGQSKRTLKVQPNTYYYVAIRIPMGRWDVALLRIGSKGIIEIKICEDHRGYSIRAS